MPAAGENELSAMTKDPQRLIQVPIGAVSPLWGLFAGAAVSGAAWWWMTRWARPANLEAAFGAAEDAVAEAETLSETLTAAVAEAVEEAPAVVEAVAEPALEAVAEAPEAVETVVEAAAEIVEAAVEAPPLPAAERLVEAAPESVGGESAPISPVLEALSPELAEPTPEPEPETEAVALKPAPRPKKAAPKAVPTAD